MKHRAVIDHTECEAKIKGLEAQLAHPTLREYRQTKVERDRYREALEIIISIEERNNRGEAETAVYAYAVLNPE